jgi:methionine-rich copper-binding protein CopC
VNRRSLLLLVVLVVGLVTASAAPAGAHAEIRESDPPAGGTAPTGTEELTLTFISMDHTEPVVVSVLDPDGNEQLAGDVIVEDPTTIGTTVRVPVRPLEEGLHLVQWRAMSSDGDGIAADTFAFEVEESAGSGLGLWLLWIVVLAVFALILLRSRGRGRRNDVPEV